MLIILILPLLIWLCILNLFNFKVRIQALITVNLMQSLNLLCLSQIFLKSNVASNYEITFNFLSKSDLLININSAWLNLNSIFIIDPTSYLFIVLTLILTPFALLANWNSIVIFNSKKLFYSLLVWTEIMLILTFSTTDLFVFYLGFEGLSIPVFFLIFLYGAEITKIRASIYFLIYSLTSSTCMALAIYLFYTQYGTANIQDLKPKFLTSIFNLGDSSSPFIYKGAGYGWYEVFESNFVPLISFERVSLIWIFLFLSFAIKLPLVPFHMWLPEAHAEAPTSGSILLTGIILKLGGYGMYKFFLPILGNFNYFLPFVHTVCILGIIYIGLTCLKVNHIKQIIAYSSIVHMNATCLGLFTHKIVSVTGAIYSMLSHSLISSSLFMMAGILYNRYESYLIENYAGLSFNMPYFSFFFTFMIIANISTPLTSGFISELLILIDLSKTNLFIFLLFGVNYLVGTSYSVWLLNRIVFTDSLLVNSKLNKLRYVYYVDLNNLEVALLSFSSILILLLGILPNTVIQVLIF